MMWAAKILARPVLIPLAVGGFGLWYGTYRLCYTGTSTIGNALLGYADCKSQSSAVGCAISGGIASLYIENAMFPIDWALPEKQILKVSSVSDLGNYFKQNADSLKKFPVGRVYGMVIISGLVSGIVQTGTERVFASYGQ
jgi:hypothetical protein